VHFRFVSITKIFADSIRKTGSLNRHRGAFANRTIHLNIAAMISAIVLNCQQQQSSSPPVPGRGADISR